MSKAFTPAWLADDPAATGLLPRRYADPTERARAVAAAAQRHLPPDVHAALTAWNQRLPADESRDRSLERLGRPGTAAVVTGQQVGLFTGPAYTLYKAATAIVAARALQAQTGVPCVPVFWLATEDHDVAEIDHALVPRAGLTPLRLQVQLADTTTDRAPVGHLLLRDDVTRVLDDLADALGGLPHAEEVVDLLRQAYLPGARMGDAFARVMAAVFAGQGLVFLDPREPAWARAAAAVHQADLLDAPARSALLVQRAEALQAAGFEPQVHLRPGAPLCFVAPDGPYGPRYRLAQAAEPEVWELSGHPRHATVPTRTILQWLEDEPLRVTSSALSRPLVQDTLLPTAAYVGGPAEIAYLAEMAPLYAHVGLPMPLALPRARFRLLDARSRAFLDELGLTPEQVAGPREDLLRHLAGQADVAEAGRLKALLDPELDQLGARMTALDPNLAKAVARARDAIHEQLERLCDKHVRAVAQRDQARLQRLERMADLLAPDGVPQERVFGLPWLAAKWGLRNLVEGLLNRTQPFSGGLEDWTP